MKNIKMINASAGSGKTFKLKEELAAALTASGKDRVRPDAVIATTFTKKAAQELRERVRVGLLEKGMSKGANLLMNSLIGTVHAVCAELLGKYSYEIGLSPKLEVLPEEDEDILFVELISQVITEEDTNRMNNLSKMLAFSEGFGEKDWKAELKNILKLARSNGMGTDELVGSADYSITTYIHILPAEGKTSKEDLVKELCKLIKNAKQEFADKDLMGLKYVVSTCQLFDQFVLGSSDNSWNKIAKIASADSGGKNKDFVAIASPIADLAKTLMSTPEFRQDIKDYISNIFAIAGRALDAYQIFKAERGLIDYADMEAYTLSALDNADVKERISQEFELLMVDEFQDTNPMQMAIFLKLAPLVKKVVWVGDPKQSIFDFRGADPELMNAVLDNVPEKNVETLDNSWRSRPELVDFSNNIFSTLFSGKLKEGQVKLDPVRAKDKKFKTAVELWNLASAKPSDGRVRNEHKYQKIAETVIGVVEEKRIVIEKDNKTFREIRPSDIAVLCRYNDDCQKVAGALKAVGLDVAMARTGLLSTPEGMFINSALKYLYNPKDTLARFELILLSDPKPNVENILDQRLEWLENKKENTPDDWGNDNHLIKWLDEYREISSEFGPSEIVRNILTVSPIVEQIELWGKHGQRQANIDVFLAKSQSYEEQTQRLGLACTISGFLLWLMDQGEDLEQGKDYGDNAVNISTYHKSKGLEWPMVIMVGMDKERKTRLYGMEAVSTKDKFDIKAPLDDRVIRYWINPFTSGKLEGLDKFEKSEIGQQCDIKSFDELTRLLYVGITRARDYLVFVKMKTKNGLSWPDELLQRKKESFEPPEEDGEHKIKWMKDKINVRKFLTTDLVNSYERPANVNVFKKAQGIKEYRAFRISPSKAEDIKTNLKVGETTEYCKGFPVIGKVDDDAAFGDCIHDVMCLGKNISVEQVETLLKNHQMDTYVISTDVHKAIQNFHVFIEKAWLKAKPSYELPVHIMLKGQFLSGICDMVLETTDGLVLIDHKTYHGPDLKLKSKTEEYLLQLELYGQMLEKATGKNVLKIFVNYISVGKLVEVL